MANEKYGELKRSFVSGGLPEDLTTALLNEYAENKRRYFLGDYGAGAVNGGRFCEAATRVLQFIGKHAFTPLADEIKVDRALVVIENETSLDEGLRLHIPRAIRLIYGVRNKRNTGHLKGGIDPSLQDATLVVGVLDWILAELVRTIHGVSPQKAQELIAGIVIKEIPLVSVLDGKPVLLRDLKHLDHVLVVLYWANVESCSRADLRSWLPAKVTANFGRHLQTASTEHFLHLDGDRVFLTRVGQRYVEDNGLLEPV